MLGKAALATVLTLALLTDCTVSPSAELINPKTGQYNKLAPAPDLAGAATPNAQIWRAPDIAEYPASAYYIPEAKYFPGPAETFGNLNTAQKEQLARALTENVRQAIGRSFRIADGPGPGVHRLDLIIGRIIPPSLVQPPPVPEWTGELVQRNDMKAGTPGLFVVAGKFYDTTTNKELAAFLAPVQVPSYMDTPTPATPESTLRFALDASVQVANDIAASVVRQQQLNQPQLMKRQPQS
jgi:hypothetical protein